MGRIEESINDGFAKEYKQKVMRQRAERLMLNEKQIKDIISFVKQNRDKLLENLSLSYDVGRVTYSIILAETPRRELRIKEFESAVSMLFWWKGIPIGALFSNKDQAAEIDVNSSYLLVGTIFKQKRGERTYTNFNVYGLIKAEDIQADIPKSKKQEQELEPEIEEYFG